MNDMTNDQRTSNDWLSGALQQAEIHRQTAHRTPAQEKIVALADEIGRLNALAGPTGKSLHELETINDALLRENERLHKIRTDETDVQRMRNTLVKAGYADLGGELWKPPLGPRPAFMDSFNKLEASVYGAVKWLLSPGPLNRIHAKDILLAAIGETEADFAAKYKDRIIQPPTLKASEPPKEREWPFEDPGGPTR